MNERGSYERPRSERADFGHSTYVIMKGPNMYPSAKLCRAQEAIHISRATGAALENERTVAAKAAKAWGAEAIAAEAREFRIESVRLYRLSAVTASREDSYFSENPDRGDASP